jgi:hypothetical protein
MDGKELCELAAQLEAERKPIEETLQECSDYLGAMPINITRPANSLKRGVDLKDNTGIIASEQLAHALKGGVTNPATKWISYESTDYALRNNWNVQRWYEECAEITMYHLNQSNFYDAIGPYYNEIVDYGTSAVLVEEGKEEIGEDILIFKPRSISELFIAENHRGQIDTVVRKARMTARQAYGKFGPATSEAIMKVYKKKPYEFVEVYHIVMPRKDWVPSKRQNPKHREFASYYVCQKDKVIMEESGYDEFPIPVGRWGRIPGFVYGYSPGMQNLPLCKYLNSVRTVELMGKQMMLAPPMVVSDDSLLSPPSFKPFSVMTKRAGRESPSFLTPPIVAQAGPQESEFLRRQIKDGFYNDIIMMQDVHYNRTATEVEQKTYERQTILSSVISQMQADFFEPLVARVFNILFRAKKFPPMPKELLTQDGKPNSNFRVVWKSPLSRKFEEHNINAIIGTMDVLSMLAQFQIPVLDRLNIDELVKEVSQIKGMPKRLLYSDYEMAQKRKQQQAAQNEQMELMKTQQVMEVADKAADVESKTDGTSGPVNAIMQQLAGK